MCNIYKDYIKLKYLYDISKNGNVEAAINFYQDNFRNSAYVTMMLDDTWSRQFGVFDDVIEFDMGPKITRNYV